MIISVVEIIIFLLSSSILVKRSFRVLLLDDGYKLKIDVASAVINKLIIVTTTHSPFTHYVPTKNKI